MRARELFFESKKEKNELSDLVRNSDNVGLLTKIANYLSSKIQAEEPRPDSEENIDNVNEEMAGNVKNTVLAMLDKLDDNSPEWAKIIDILRRDEVSELSTQVVQTKLGSVNGYLDKKLRDLVMRSKAPFEQKEEFLRKLASGDGYFDGKELLNQRSGNIYQMLSSNPVAADLGPKMALEFRGDMGYGPDQGPGEIMMTLLGKNIQLASKGDLKIGNQVAEVKATSRSKKGKKGFSGGRLYSTTGYGSGFAIKKDLYKNLLAVGIPEQALLEYGLPTRKAATDSGVEVKKGGVNLNLSGLANINGLFKEYEVSPDQAKTVIKGIVDGLYTKLPSGMEKGILNLIQNDGTFDPQDFLIEMTKLAHVYYMGLEGHDSLMLFNTDSGNYAVMYTAEDVEKLLRDGIISLTSHIDLEDDRGKGSSQLIIK